MESPQSIPPALERNNIYALLSAVGGGIATLANCFTLVSVIIPTLPFLCATISGLFSLGSLAAGVAGLVQVRKSGQKGKGLAITGILLSVLGLIAACIIPFIGTAVWALLGFEIGNNLLVR